MRLRVLVACLALAAPAAAQAGAPSAAEIGQRVKVRTSAGSTIVGGLQSIDGQAVRIRRTDEVVTVPWTEITRLDVSAGRSSKRGKIIGAVVGALLSGLSCAANCEAGSFEINVPLGAGMGTLVGSAFKREVWRRVPADRWPTAIAQPALAPAEP
jgi:hypothetical protein